MKLQYFLVKNYRSILTATIDKMYSSIILIGPNNEGKSNILQGLNICLSILTSEDTITTKEHVKLRYNRDDYDWTRDYPIDRQNKFQNGESIFELHFQLTSEERKIFKRMTGSSLSDILPIELRFGQSMYASFKVMKRGPGGSVLSGKSDKIRMFITHVLDFVYIPAIRNADTSIEVVSQLFRREMRELELREDYKKLEEQLKELQKPILKRIQSSLKTTLNLYLNGKLKDISIDINSRSRTRFLGQTCNIIIDDGTPTILERKGDGIQSLVAISLLSSTIQQNDANKDIILLIEEPESHLHPRAIHQLRAVIDTIKENNQVFITTHSPLLVNHENIPSNVIVTKNRATYAKSISQIRDVLGVRGSDNLQNTSLVIVVEGNEDEISLREVFSSYSENIKAALKEKTLAFYPIGGASKLSYSLQMLKHNMCNYLIILDDDKEARNSYKVAQDNLLATKANTYFLKAPGLIESEFEDFIDEKIYKKYFTDNYGVDVTTTMFKQKLKWSQRIRSGLERSGKSSSNGEAWSERDEYKTKSDIADIVAAYPLTSIIPGRLPILQSIINAIEIKHKSILTKIV